MKQIDSGAEAIILKDGKKILKKRVTKSYRIKQIDDKLRKSRAKKELKVLNKLKELGFNVPTAKSSGKYDIEMEFIKGDKVKVCLKENLDKISKDIGKTLAKLHNLDLIHGDLTTSNMIFSDNKLYLIDFGLSQTTKRIEDKAVDLHLLRQALESYHYDCWEKSFKLILKEYEKNSNDSDLILTRLGEVEKRGRNKH